jgi:hypothetical protein
MCSKVGVFVWRPPSFVDIFLVIIVFVFVSSGHLSSLIG